MSTSLRDRLTGLLLGRGLVSQAQLDEALKIQKQKNERLSDILVRLGHLSPESLLEVLSAELGVPAIRLSKYKITPDTLATVPKKIADFYCLIPVSKIGPTLTLAMADPTNVQAMDDVKRLTRLEVHPLVAAEKEIREAIEHYYGKNVREALEEAVQSFETADSIEWEETGAASALASSQELLRLTEEEPVVKLTNSILLEGIRRHSSDIFIEPEESSMRVRFRVDGVLQEGLSTTRSMHAGVVSRIKVISNLDIAEHRVPQDGRFKIKVHQTEDVDFRVSVIPTYFGEKVVLRVLDKTQTVLDLEKLGFEPQPLSALKQAAEHPYGMMVICGPTGSGKTTTLYAVLKHVDSPAKNCVTVEDPVEFQLEGINQVSIRPEVQLTFAAALRSILRQDPDVIMVGEIRDSETADVAIKAALTGHLVLSTLHATTAPGAVTRLLNMGIEPFLITSSFLLSGSQRLVRTICVRCKESYEPSKELIKQLGFGESQLTGKKTVFYRGRGCEACSKTGYRGRAVLLEALLMTSRIKELVIKGAQEHEIKKAARAEGMQTLRENGLAKILAGVTTPEEVMRVTVRDEAPAKSGGG